MGLSYQTYGGKAVPQGSGEEITWSDITRLLTPFEDFGLDEPRPPEKVVQQWKKPPGAQEKPENRRRSPREVVKPGQK